MKLSKGDLVLYSLHMIKEDQRTDRVYSKASLSNAIGISENTLDLYLTRLKTQGFLDRFKKKYIQDLRRTVEITDIGKEYIGQISNALEYLLLTEKRHNIPACIQLTKVMATLHDPMEKAFFLSLYSHNKFFDLPMLLNSLRISKDEINIINIFSKIESCPLRPKESYVESIFKASFYGDFDPERLKTDEWPKEDLNALIILGQAKRRMGKLDDSKMIFDYLLSRSDLDSNQWFTTRFNIIHWHIKKDDLDNAIKLSDSLIASVDNKVMQAYTKLLKGEALFHRGNRREAMELYKSAIGSFSACGLPLFLSLAHNGRGVSFFIMGEYKDAEKDWIKARKYAREARSEFAEAKVLPNLADIAMQGGKFDLCKSYLYKAAEIFRKYNDYEGMAIVEYNMALLCLEKGDLEGVREHYKKSREIAFPLPPEFMMAIFKEEMIRRAKEKNVPDIEKYL